MTSNALSHSLEPAGRVGGLVLRLVLAVALSACSGSGSSGEFSAVQSAVQSLVEGTASSFSVGEASSASRIRRDACDRAGDAAAEFELVARPGPGFEFDVDAIATWWRAEFPDVIDSRSVSRSRDLVAAGLIGGGGVGFGYDVGSNTAVISAYSRCVRAPADS